jgi:hypothetical protein
MNSPGMFFLVSILFLNSHVLSAQEVPAGLIVPSTPDTLTISTADTSLSAPADSIIKLLLPEQISPDSIAASPEGTSFTAETAQPPADSTVSEKTIIIPESLPASQVSPDPVADKEQNVIGKLRYKVRVTPEPKYMRSGCIMLLSDIPRNTVMPLESDRASAILNEYITVKGLDAPAGTVFSVVSSKNNVRHPVNKTNMGVVLHVNGIAKVVSVSDGKARCVITASFNPITPGNVLIPYSAWTSGYFDAWVKPHIQISGIILAIDNPTTSVRMEDILYIDKGARDGMSYGDRLMIYSRDENKITGEIEITKVYQNYSAGSVVSLRERNVEVGDRVELYARCRIAP